MKSRVPNPDNSLSVRDLADAEGVSVPTIWREIAAGRLIARKIGRRTIILPDDRAQWRRALPRVRASAAS